ncbi:MAG: hypothetical protein EGQ57_01150 [Alphaproteobacteria bacterium]|nr:hypothetical protein [Alphaproteobacteria bacterium]
MGIYILASGTSFDNALLKVFFLYVFQAFTKSDFSNFRNSYFKLFMKKLRKSSPLSNKAQSDKYVILINFL